MDKVPDLYHQVVGLSKSVDENFLELGRMLRELQDTDPEKFRLAVQSPALGQRKAYYLVTIDRTFSKIPVKKDRLKRIGWTKLNILSRHINKTNYAELLKHAENYTAKELEQLLRGEEPMTNARAVLAYFPPEDYALLEKALLMFKGQKSGKGIVNKEEAIMNMVKYVLKMKKDNT
ncbi:MAG: hypothetical protein KJZ83_00145 [Burkholderiaceae bacterium]|nr:hypothetical protein [Burkholderiaceae bacterium]